MIEHVISRNCRIVHRGGVYSVADYYWEQTKRELKPGDFMAWDHESTERSDFADPPHCGLVTVPAVYSGAMLLHPEKYVLTVARYEKSLKRRAHARTR